MPKISVIVPVYNVEKYLNRCVDSILSQTFEDFELILVDDGSKDNSGKICDEYANLDNRVKVIHKKNAGVSSARNTGIEISQGEFISFVDADDWFEKDALRQLYDATEGNSAVYGGYKIVWKKTSRVDTLPRLVASGQKLCEIFVDSSFQNYYFFITVWSKLYRAEIIKKNNIFFDSGIPYGEDTMFNIKVCSHCDRVAFIDVPVYNYDCQNMGSASKKYYHEMYEYRIAISKVINEWLSQYDMSRAADILYIGFLILVIRHYLTNCGIRLSVYHLKRIYSAERDNILNNIEKIDTALGGGYASLIKKERFGIVAIKWKLRHIKIYSKKKIKAVLRILIRIINKIFGGADE